MKYNLGKYNVGGRSGSEGLRPITARIRMKASRPVISNIAHPKAEQAAIRTQAHATLTVRKTLKANPAGITSSARAKLTVYIHLKAKPAGISVKASKPMPRAYGMEMVSFPGLVLLPGETLTIDMDEITAKLDGVNVIKYWETGSQAFRLANGRNVISYFDDSDGRNASVSVIWRDRYY